MSMKVPVNTMTQDELNTYLERVVKSAFLEGVLWMKCGGKNLSTMEDAIASAKNSIIYDGL